MLFKLALKEFKKNLPLNLLIIFLMTVIFIVIIGVVSSVTSRFKYYQPFADILKENGFITNFTVAMIPHEDDLTKDYFEEFYELYENVQSIDYNCKQQITNPNYELSEVLYYGDRAVQFKPRLKKGKWLTEVKMKNDVIPIVVSQSKENYKIGDILEFKDYKNVVFEYEVVGILEDNTKINGLSLNGNTYSTIKKDIGIEEFYATINSEVEEQPIFLSAMKFLPENAQKFISGEVYFTFNEDITDEQISHNLDTVINMTGGQTTDYADLKEKTLEYIYSQLYNIVPIIISIFIFVIIAILTVSAINVKQQLRNYAVYYILGLRWEQTIIINFCVTIITMIFSVAFTILISVSAIYTNLLKNTIIEFGLLQIIICLCIGILIAIFSMIMPILLINNSSAKEVLRRN